MFDQLEDFVVGSAEATKRSVGSPGPIAIETGAWRSGRRRFRPGLVVADIIPNPPRTRLIRDAEGMGCTVLDGLGMLVNQGVINIKYWTGVDADAGVMRKTLEGIFGV